MNQTSEWLCVDDVFELTEEGAFKLLKGIRKEIQKKEIACMKTDF